MADSAVTRRSSAKEVEAITRLTERLRGQFPELSAEEIDAAVSGRYREFDDSPIRDFVPVLVERAVVTKLGSGHRHRA